MFTKFNIQCRSEAKEIPGTSTPENVSDSVRNRTESESSDR